MLLYSCGKNERRKRHNLINTFFTFYIKHAKKAKFVKKKLLTKKKKKNDMPVVRSHT